MNVTIMTIFIQDGLYPMKRKQIIINKRRVKGRRKIKEEKQKPLPAQRPTTTVIK